MFNKKLLCATLILNLGLSSAVMARHHGMMDYDSNGDGSVSKEEIQAGRMAEFKAHDNNKDASLSLDELKTLSTNKRNQRKTVSTNKRNQRMAKRLEKLDSDGNGQVTFAEFQTGALKKGKNMSTRVFALADSNQDKVLDAQEMAALKSSEGRVLFKFAHMDSDGNGLISETEYSEHKPVKGGRHGRKHRYH